MYEYYSTTKFSHVFHIHMYDHGERTKLKLHEIIAYEIFSTRNITKLWYILDQSTVGEGESTEVN